MDRIEDIIIDIKEIEIIYENVTELSVECEVEDGEEIILLK